MTNAVMWVMRRTGEPTIGRSKNCISCGPVNGAVWPTSPMFAPRGYKPLSWARKCHVCDQLRDDAGAGTVISAATGLASASCVVPTKPEPEVHMLGGPMPTASDPDLPATIDLAALLVLHDPMPLTGGTGTRSDITLTMLSQYTVHSYGSAELRLDHSARPGAKNAKKAEDKALEWTAELDWHGWSLLAEPFRCSINTSVPGSIKRRGRHGVATLMGYAARDAAVERVGEASLPLDGNAA